MLNFLLQKKLAFAIWSFPGEQDWQGVAQNDDEVDQLEINEIHTAKGFVVAPFNAKGLVSLIRPDIEFNSTNFSLKNTPEDNDEIARLYPDKNDFFVIDKKAYIASCKHLISSIKKGEVKKIILSRILPVSFQWSKLIRFFKSLIKTHQNAFVFIYSTGNEVWIGASPEVFMEVKNNRFKTMALAGSKPAGDASEWGQKELDEQAYVTRFINQKLKETEVAFEQSELNTVSAGPVAHLQTVFRGDINKHQLSELIKKMHPTPAVCGIPKEKAMDMISETEKHDRRDYTGYIGPVNRGDINLFVNLRSALVGQNLLYLFLGGGITSESVPGKEWEETGLKAKTLIDCYKKC